MEAKYEHVFFWRLCNKYLCCLLINLDVVLGADAVHVSSFLSSCLEYSLVEACSGTVYKE